MPIHNGNPADVGGGATADDYKFVIEQFINEKNIDIIDLNNFIFIVLLP